MTIFLFASGHGLSLHWSTWSVAPRTTALQRFGWSIAQSDSDANTRDTKCISNQDSGVARVPGLDL